MTAEFRTIQRADMFNKNFLAEMKVCLSPNKSGDWILEKFTIDEEASKGTKINAMTNMLGRGYVPPGEYTRLKNVSSADPFNDGIWMSDTPDECRVHIGFLAEAKGRVLIGGLGIGLAIKPLIENPDVEHITVLEIDPHVINLVAGHYECRYGPQKLEIIKADVFKWKPDSQMFDSCWMDIWYDICADNLQEMARLRRRYKKWCRKIDFWCYIEMRRLQLIGY